MDRIDYTQLTNEQLLECYSNSDAAAFGEFYGRNSKLIYNFILSRLKNNADAEEAFQEVFMRIHKYVLRFDPKQMALGWAFQISRNVIIDLIKKRKYGHIQIEEVHDQPSVDPRIAIDALAEIESLLGHLNEDEKMLLKDKFINEKSYDEIAAKKDITASSARQRVSRLVRKLKLHAK